MDIFDVNSLACFWDKQKLKHFDFLKKIRVGIFHLIDFMCLSIFLLIVASICKKISILDLNLTFQFFMIILMWIGLLTKCENYICCTFRKKSEAIKFKNVMELRAVKWAFDLLVVNTMLTKSALFQCSNAVLLSISWILIYYIEVHINVSGSDQSDNLGYFNAPIFGYAVNHLNASSSYKYCSNKI